MEAAAVSSACPEEKGDECCLCMFDIALLRDGAAAAAGGCGDARRRVRLRPCGHTTFCESRGLEGKLSASCPLCRAPVASWDVVT